MTIFSKVHKSLVVLSGAIDDATAKRKEILDLSDTAEPTEITELRAKKEKKETILAHLKATLDIIGDDDDDMASTYKMQISNTEAQITDISKELDDLVSERESQKKEKEASIEKLSAEYDGQVSKAKKLLAEYYGLFDQLDTYLLETISELEKPLNDTQETSEEPETAAPEEIVTADSTAKDTTSEETVIVDSPANNTTSEEIVIADSHAEDTTSDSSTDSGEDVPPDVLGGLLSAMKKFDDIAKDYVDESGEYTRDLKPLYNELKLTQKEKMSIKGIVQSAEVKGLSKKHTYVLKNSIPLELLMLCGLREFAEDRATGQPGYFEGALNKWRPAFTYSVISKLCNLVYSNASYEKIADFFEENTDRLVKGKVWPHFEKEERRAFAKL